MTSFITVVFLRGDWVIFVLMPSWGVYRLLFQICSWLSSLMWSWWCMPFFSSWKLRRLYSGGMCVVCACVGQWVSCRKHQFHCCGPYLACQGRSHPCFVPSVSCVFIGIPSSHQCRHVWDYLYSQSHERSFITMWLILIRQPFALCKILYHVPFRQRLQCWRPAIL